MAEFLSKAQTLATKHSIELCHLVDEMEESLAFEIEHRSKAETALIILWGVVDENKIPEHQRELVMLTIINSAGYYGTSYAAELQARLDKIKADKNH